MKNLTKTLIALLCAPMLLFAQEEESTKYNMVVAEYIKVKVGMEAKFVEAVKKHNAKFHTKAPYASSLFRVSTGNEAGWFIWTMGTMTFTDVDGAPGSGAHADDWTKTIAPYVEEYGRSEYWRLNEKLSSFDDDSEPLQTVWFLDVKRGEYYRFKAFMEKVAKIHQNKKEEMHVWMNEFNQADGRDVAVTWPMDKWADLDSDDWKMKDEFDKEYGEGAWENALEEWEDVVEGVVQEVWERAI